MKNFILLTTITLSILFVTNSIAAELDGECFEFVYPLSFEKSDGSTVEVKDEEEMISYKNSWKGLEKHPVLKFPIEVKWQGREAISIESQEVLDKHWARCKAKLNSNSVNKKCFEFVYPLSFEKSDGSTLEVKAKEELISYKTSWKGMEKYPVLIFPIEVKWERREVMSVESQDVLDRHLARCKAKLNSNSVKKRCFNIVYPVTFTVAGNEVEVNSVEDMTIQRKEWSENQIVPKFNYPIEIQWEGKDVIKVNTDEEMKSWRMKCRDL